MFSNLNRVGHPLHELASRMIKQCSKVNLGSTSWRLWGNLCSYSFEYKNLSNLLQTGKTCMFDNVKDAFLREGSINSLSFMNPSKSLILEVKLAPPNVSKIFLMRLKSPQHTILDKLNQKGLVDPSRNPSWDWNYWGYKPRWAKKSPLHLNSA